MRTINHYIGFTEWFIGEIAEWPIADRLTALTCIVEAIAKQENQSTALIQRVTTSLLAEPTDKTH